MHDYSSRIMNHFKSLILSRRDKANLLTDPNLPVLPLRSLQVFKPATLLLNLTLLFGCGTFDPANIAERPWNRPTPEETVPDPWPMLTPVPQERPRPLDHCPRPPP
jgi:hypothetical protein